MLTNATSQYWPNSIRWTFRSSFEYYLTCEWKQFCRDNMLVADYDAPILQFSSRICV